MLISSDMHVTIQVSGSVTSILAFALQHYARFPSPNQSKVGACLLCCPVMSWRQEDKRSRPTVFHFLKQHGNLENYRSFKLAVCLKVTSFHACISDINIMIFLSIRDFFFFFRNNRLTFQVYIIFTK